MKIRGLTPILNVANIVESFEWFEKLGWQKGWDWGDPPSFGGVCTGKYEISLPKRAGIARRAATAVRRRRHDRWCLDELVARVARGGRRSISTSTQARVNGDDAADERALGRSRVPSATSRRTHVPRQRGIGRRIKS